MSSIPNRALAAAAWASCAVACSEEATVVLPANTNEVRNRSVRVDASKLSTKGGTPIDVAGFETDPSGDKAKKLLDYTAACVGANCHEFKATATDGVKVASLMGINGTAQHAFATDDANPKLFKDSFSRLYTGWHRIPVGYGCKAMMQTLFPDRTKDVAAIDNYNLAALDKLIESVRTAGAWPVWTIGYDIGTAGEACVYDKGEVKGKPIQDPARFAKAAARIASWYDFHLPEKKKAEQGGDPLCRDKTVAQPPWYCNASVVDFEFLRDPFGAGGYTKDTKAGWLEAYRQFAIEMRQTFALPSNGVRLIAPSIVITSDLDVQDTASATRSPIFDFIDFVVDPKHATKDWARLPLSCLSLEIEASSPVTARSIVERVAAYAEKKGLKYEAGLFGNPGTAPIPICIMDLRIIPPANSVAAKLADKTNAATYDGWRSSAWRGGFLTATKMLWQGLVTDATIAAAVRFPKEDPATLSSTALAPADLIAKLRDSDLLWYSEDKIPSGALKPMAWPGFWLHPSHMGGQQIVTAQQGPDALGMSSKQLNNPEKGIVVLATRSSCVNANRSPTACVVDAASSPSSSSFYAKGKQNLLRVLVTDFQVEMMGSKEVLEHKLRVQVDGLPSTAKVAGFQMAWIDGTAPTWSEVIYRDQGFVDITNGSLGFTRNVQVPAVLFYEVYF